MSAWDREASVLPGHSTAKTSHSGFCAKAAIRAEMENSIQQTVDF
jgi:hypothetical protein